MPCYNPNMTALPAAACRPRSEQALHSSIDSRYYTGGSLADARSFKIALPSIHRRRPEGVRTFRAASPGRCDERHRYLAAGAEHDNLAQARSSTSPAEGTSSTCATRSRNGEEGARMISDALIATP
jgi:hypothetical protein